MDICHQSNVSAFNALSRWVITFLPRSKGLLISWLQSPSAVILEPKKIKSVTVSIISPSICHEVMGPEAIILVFWMLSFKPAFSLSSFTFIKRLFQFLLTFCLKGGGYHPHIWGYWYFCQQSWFQLVLHSAWHFAWCTLHRSYISRVTIYSPYVQLSQFWTSLLFMSSSNCCFLTCMQVSQEAGKVVWYSYLLKNFPQLFVIHTVKGFSVVNEAEVDVFLEFSCFFDDPMDVGNLISGSSTFFKFLNSYT